MSRRARHFVLREGEERVYSTPTSRLAQNKPGGGWKRPVARRGVFFARLRRENGRWMGMSENSWRGPVKPTEQERPGFPGDLRPGCG